MQTAFASAESGPRKKPGLSHNPWYTQRLADYCLPKRAGSRYKSKRAVSRTVLPGPTLSSGLPVNLKASHILLFPVLRYQ